MEINEIAKKMGREHGRYSGTCLRALKLHNGDEQAARTWLNRANQYNRTETDILLERIEALEATNRRLVAALSQYGWLGALKNGMNVSKLVRTMIQALNKGT